MGNKPGSQSALGKVNEMIDGIERMKKVIEYIEDNIRGEISVEKAAAIMCVSTYEFRRLFSFLAGASVAEYIRMRRLSLAALDLKKNVSITEVANRYGYDSLSSFSRAFKEMHGISPSKAADGDVKLRLFTKPVFEVSMSGGENVEYRVIDDKEFTISGFSMLSPFTDTECCENVWEAFYHSGLNDRLADYYAGEQYAAYFNSGDNVKCVIGARTSCTDGFDKVKIDKSLWLCFKVRGLDEDKVNGIYYSGVGSWVESAGFERDYALPNIEIFPSECEGDDFEWEIRIPVKEGSK